MIFSLNIYPYNVIQRMESYYCFHAAGNPTAVEGIHNARATGEWTLYLGYELGHVKKYRSRG